jgi:hypothetical protein
MKILLQAPIQWQRLIVEWKLRAATREYSSRSIKDTVFEAVCSNRTNREREGP